MTIMSIPKWMSSKLLGRSAPTSGWDVPITLNAFRSDEQAAGVLEADEEARDVAMSAMHIPRRRLISYITTFSLDRSSVSVWLRTIGADVEVRLRQSEPHHYALVDYYWSYY